VIRFGTCSWKYDSWQDIVYSPKAKSNYLLEYSQKYNTVEIDQWFWSLFSVDKVSLPLPNIVQEYNQSVPDDFKFTIKMPNSITLTHFYRKNKYEDLKENPYFLSHEIFARFMELLQPMHKKIGILMFQFEYLNKQKMSSQHEFLARLSNFISRCSAQFCYAIEIRNPNYLNSKYFQFLNDHRLSHVFLQGYYLPSLIQIYSRYGSQIQDTVVIRLHGPDRGNIEEKSKGRWNKILEPKDAELSRITEIIEELNTRNIDVYVNVNNHYEGSAPLTIEKIQRMMEA
jgi:uncharacterized protein YecE (DUF72 family)